MPKALPTRYSAPPRTDESTWGPSRISLGRRVNKGEAKKRYDLRDCDFEGLDFVKVPTPIDKGGRQMVVRSHSYSERDVERAAWRRYGGPDGFQAHLNRLREYHQRGHSGGLFESPQGYNPATRFPAPSRTDESTWRPSIIPPGNRVNKGEAKKRYDLRDCDLEGLDFVKVTTPINKGGRQMTVAAHSYSERDVERAAWRRYGGPDGFQAHLNRLREYHQT
ncbi:hypothetical protein D9611_007856 [Ephemerocybe angulata]|uniref:Uncharacterized protein n=1 Tax=Ephemerocybe angulata TaxID=980116 RepID=A0A8H5FKM8_9AGAR|nr:hypothetical protein D9611_007856 [Tulosesus angulatus]